MDFARVRVWFAIGKLWWLVIYTSWMVTIIVARTFYLNPNGMTFLHLLLQAMASVLFTFALIFVYASHDEEAKAERKRSKRARKKKIVSNDPVWDKYVNSGEFDADVEKHMSEEERKRPQFYGRFRLDKDE